jgi:hypothetical protein
MLIIDEKAVDSVWHKSAERRVSLQVQCPDKPATGRGFVLVLLRVGRWYTVSGQACHWQRLFVLLLAAGARRQASR